MLVSCEAVTDNGGLLLSDDQINTSGIVVSLGLVTALLTLDLTLAQQMTTTRRDR